MKVDGDFAQTSTCGFGVAAGTSCTISIVFTPVSEGNRTGTLTITDNDNGVANATHSVTLSGTGVMPHVSLSPQGLTFAEQTVDTASAAQAVALTNSGTAPLTISAISSTGDFTQTNNCGGSVVVAASCTINVIFTPKTTGTLAGSLVISDNAAGSPHSVALTGSGSRLAISLLPASLTFAGQVVGTSSTSQQLIITNSGTAALSIAAIVASGDFSQTNTCSRTIAINASCTVNVLFTPTASGTRTGSITISDTAPGNPHVAAVGGVGLAPLVTLSPTALAFGAQPVSTNSAAQTVMLTNVGTAALAIANVAISGDFTQTNTCGVNLPAAGTCKIDVTFAPKAAGAGTGSITISDNAAGSPRTIALSGIATDFALLAPSGNSTSATVSAGQPATFNLSISGSGGVSGPASLACSGAPTASTCSVAPSSVTLTGTVAVPFTVTVTTTARSSNTTVLNARVRPTHQPDWMMFIAAVFFGGEWLRTKKSRLLLAAGTFVLLCLLLLTSCGGSDNSSASKQPVGTQAGTYTLTVTATSGQVSRTQTLTLVVN
jgi:hypothetical protein